MEKFEKTLNELTKSIEGVKKSASSKEKCFPTMIVLGVLAPILVWILLYFLQPSFVQKREGDEYTRNSTKVFYWTVLITLIIWVALYLFSFCSGNKNMQMFCTKRM